MTQRVFIRVIGFSDVERHALNTVFRLSERRETEYAPWTAASPQEPQLALIDGQSYEALMELASPGNAHLKLIWIGPVAPPGAWRCFDRPITWPEVVQAMDELFATAAAIDFDIDPDFDGNGPDTQPPEPEGPAKRALIASADRDHRLYLRARLALARITQADEAETAAQVQELVRVNHYAVALVDFALPGDGGWSLLKSLAQVQPPIAHVIVTKADASPGERVRAWFGGVASVMDKPPHPGKLRGLLQKV